MKPVKLINKLTRIIVVAAAGAAAVLFTCVSRSRAMDAPLGGGSALPPAVEGPPAPYMELCAALPDWGEADYEALLARYRESDNGWQASTCLGRCGDPGSPGEGT